MKIEDDYARRNREARAGSGWSFCGPRSVCELRIFGIDWGPWTEQCLWKAAGFHINVPQRSMTKQTKKRN